MRVCVCVCVHITYLEVLQRHQYLLREAPDEPHTQPCEVVLLDELVQVDRQHLKGDAQMVAEHEVLLQRTHTHTHAHTPPV